MRWRAVSVGVALAGSFMGGVALAQYRVPSQIVPEIPRVVSGSDVGFRIEGRRGNAVIGALVVRVDGEWVDVDGSANVKRLTAK